MCEKTRKVDRWHLASGIGESPVVGFMNKEEFNKSIEYIMDSVMADRGEFGYNLKTPEFEYKFENIFEENGEKKIIKDASYPKMVDALRQYKASLDEE